VNRAWKVGASVASAAFAVVVEPSVVVPVGSGTTRRYALPRKLVYTPHGRECRWNKKVQGVFPYYLIAVHEEAGDECAHAQLVADRFRLRYRDTSLSTSNETTRTLPKAESWVEAWLEFFFRSTLGFFSMLRTKTEEQLLGEERNRRNRWTSGNVAKASRRKNKSGGDVELRRFWARGSLYNRCRAATVI
jgi:hypothetical protein